MTAAKSNQSHSSEVTLDEAMKALGRLGKLTYQQRQLVEDGDLDAVLQQHVAFRNLTQWLSWGVVVACGVYAVLGLLSELSHWICAAISIFVILHIRRQKRRIEEVSAVVQNYVETLPRVDENEERLLVRELKSRYPLSYLQLRKLKAGQAAEVARECLVTLKKSRRMQWASFGLWALALIFFGFGFARLGTSIQPLSWGDLLVRFASPILMIILGSFRHRMTGRQIKRLQLLLNEHLQDTVAIAAEEMPGAEIEGDTNSPYRSPRFR